MNKKIIYALSLFALCAPFTNYAQDFYARFSLEQAQKKKLEKENMCTLVNALSKEIQTAQTSEEILTIIRNVDRSIEKIYNFSDYLTIEDKDYFKSTLLNLVNNKIQAQASTKELTPGPRSLTITQILNYVLKESFSKIAFYATVRIGEHHPSMFYHFYHMLELKTIERFAHDALLDIEDQSRQKYVDTNRDEIYAAIKSKYNGITCNGKRILTRNHPDYYEPDFLCEISWQIFKSKIEKQKHQ